SLAPAASCWRSTAHGTAGLPAISAPPTTSALVGSSPETLSALLIPAAASSFTCAPDGSPCSAAAAVPAVASATAVVATAARSFRLVPLLNPITSPSVVGGLASSKGDTAGIARRFSGIQPELLTVP